MKRAEILKAFDNCRLSVPGGEQAVLAFAQALGVTVEPDEPELPERMSVQHITQSLFAHYRNGLVETVAKLTGSPNAPEVIDALVDAYNSRKAWRTGDPPERGLYLSCDDEGGRSYCYWNGAYFQLGGSSGVRCPHTHWMPLPDPPKP